MGRPLSFVKFEVPQRQQLASEGSVLETPSYGTERAFGARKPPFSARKAFSEAFGVKNRLFRYGRDIRCRKQPSLVRDASSVRGTASARRRANIKRGCIPWKSLRIHPQFLNVLCPGPDSNRHIFKG